MKKTKLFLAMVLGLCLLSGCAGKRDVPSDSGGGGGGQAQSGETAAENAAVKDEVTVVLKGEPSNIDPHGNTELVAMTTQVQIFETLVKKDEEGNIVPGLAESWEQVDDKTIRFKLRDNVYFHNGEKMTADDVVYTIQRATKKPSSASIFASFDAENTKAVDELTVDVATKAPFAAVYNYLTSTRGGIVSKKAVEEMGDDQFGRSPVGTGPFAFDNWVSGTSITLKRNDNYWGEKPAYSTLTLKFITETANRALEIESGNADIVLDPDTGDLDRLAETDGLKVVSGDSYGMSYIVFSMDDKVLSDVRIRQALSLALDLDSLVETVYGNYATVSESVMPSTVFSYKSQGRHEYNVEKAKELLAEAGYPDGFSCKLLSSSTYAMHEQTAVCVQSSLAEIGIKVELELPDWATRIERSNVGDYDMMVSGTTGNIVDMDWATNYYESGDVRMNSCPGFADDKIDELLQKGRTTLDEKEREEIYDQFRERALELSPFVFINFREQVFATAKNVHGFQNLDGILTYLSGLTLQDTYVEE